MRLLLLFSLLPWLSLGQNEILNLQGNQSYTGSEEISDLLKKIIKWISSTDWKNVLENFENNVKEMNISEECLSDLRFVRDVVLDHDGLRKKISFNDSKAVLQMLDASAKIPSGVMRGKIVWTGLPNECFAIRQLVKKRQRHLGGAYCRANLEVPGIGCADSVDQAIFNRPMIGYDICIPSSCRPDIENVLNQSIKFTTVCEVKCMEEESRLSVGSYVTLTILALLTIITVYATFLDYYVVKENKETVVRMNFWMECIMCFSLYTNVPAIFDLTVKPGQITMLNGVRFFSILWVISGHMIVIVLLTADNPLDVMEEVHHFSMQWLVNAYFSVDTFFFISGFLTAFLFFKYSKDRPQQAFSPVGWLMYYVHRILRLSPPYYMIIAFHTWITPELMRRSINTFIYYPFDSCQKSWWANFLYITNYYHVEDQCYVSSWYLSTDFQIFAMAPIVLIAFSWKKNIGYILSGVLLLISFVIHMVIIMYYHFPPNDVIQAAVPHDPQMTVPYSKYTLLIYDAPWIRYPPYLIGIVTGHFMQTTQRIKMSKVTSSVIFLVVFCTMFALTHVLYGYFQGNLLPIFLRALYSSLSKPLWGFCLAWLVYACYHGYGGFVNDFLSLQIFVPFGRLAYSVYLLHMTVIFIMGSLRGNRYLYSNGWQLLVSCVVPVCIVTFLLAILLSAVLEIGTGKLEAKLLGMEKRRRENAPKTS